MTATAAATETGLYPKRWYALWSLCLSLLIVVVGNTSLNVAIPTLSRELDATNSQLQWSVAIYSLVFAGLLFTTGALGDRFGRKGALQFGLLLFMIGTAALSTVVSDVPCCAVFMAVALGLFERMGLTPGTSNFARSVMIGIPIASLIGGVGTPAGIITATFHGDRVTVAPEDLATSKQGVSRDPQQRRSRRRCGCSWSA